MDILTCKYAALNCSFYYVFNFLTVEHWRLKLFANFNLFLFLFSYFMFIITNENTQIRPQRYKRLTWREREFSDVVQVLFYLLSRHFFVNLTLLQKLPCGNLIENGPGKENLKLSCRAQFVIFKPLSYCFEETIGFDLKASFTSCPLSRLIRWCNKPGDITK